VTEPGWWVRRLEDVPRIPPEEPNDPDWYPLQHHFGLTAFGANAYVAPSVGDLLVGEHDESSSEQEEIYVVTTGRARFTLAGEEHDAAAVSVVAVRDPAVRRSAVALEAGTTVLAIGGKRDPTFRSSWQAHHFEGVPRAG
jgi:hypothetical protein